MFSHSVKLKLNIDDEFNKLDEINKFFYSVAFGDYEVMQDSTKNQNDSGIYYFICSFRHSEDAVTFKLLYGQDSYD